MKKCPRCAELVQPDARVCRFCGFDFVRRSAPKPPPTSFNQCLGCLAIIVAVPVGLAIIGLGGGSSNPTPAPTFNGLAASDAERFGNTHSAQLALRSAADRAQLLGAIVKSAGERCRTPDRTMYQGKDGTTAFWNLACGNADWTISIDASSSTKVLSCRLRRRLGSRCWTNF